MQTVCKTFVGKYDLQHYRVLRSPTTVSNNYCKMAAKDQHQ